MPAKTRSTANKKSNNILRKIDLNTTKGRMIVTLLAFALVGGGIMVFRSFAATASWTYTAGQKTIILGETPTSSPCKVNTVELGDAKNPNPGFNLKCAAPGVAVANSIQAAYVVPKATPVDATMVGWAYEICADVRGQGAVNLELMSSDAQGGNKNSTLRTVNVSSAGFTKACGYAVAPITAGNLYGKVLVSQAGSSIDVSAITVRQYSYASTASTSSVPASTATPAPAK